MEVEDKKNVEAIMNVVLEVNKKGFGKVKEEAVASALRELMASEIEKEVEEAVQKAVEEALEKASQETQKVIQEMEQTVIVALENGLEESLIRKLVPSISDFSFAVTGEEIHQQNSTPLF